MNYRNCSYEEAFIRYFDLLDSERRSRIERCATQDAREHLLFTGAALMKVLSKRGVKASELFVSDRGKPYVVDHGDLCFNLSHSGDRLVIAVSDGPVGIDIQKAVAQRDAITKRISTVEEISRFHSMITDDFKLFWAIKESYSKLTGLGIGTDYTKITFEKDDKDIRIFEKGIKKAVGRIFEDGPDYSGAVCMYDDFTVETASIVL